MKSSHKLKNERSEYIQAIKQPFICIHLSFFINQMKIRQLKFILQSVGLQVCRSVGRLCSHRTVKGVKSVRRLIYLLVQWVRRLSSCLSPFMTSHFNPFIHLFIFQFIHSSSIHQFKNFHSPIVDQRSRNLALFNPFLSP